METQQKPELVTVLRTLLADVFTAQYEGANYQKLARAFGYADGYMRALLEAGVADKDELIGIVMEERRRRIEDTPKAA